MTITSLHFLGILFLISTSVWVCLTENPVCDEESVYYYYTESCFKLFNVESDILTTNQCTNYTGGEHHNVSGRVAHVYFDDIRIFLREYLQYLKVPRAVVELDRFYCYISDNSLYKFLDQMETCRGIGKSNLRGFLAISLAEALGTPLNWESVSHGYKGEVICQAQGAGKVPTESICPSNVTVESVSDSNVTFHITPGETKTQVQVRFSVNKPCINLTSSVCEEPVTSLDKKVFLLKPTTLTVFKLEPSTRYRARFEIDNYLSILGTPLQCNRTIDFTTDAARQGEENSYKGQVIALSVLLVCSLCVIVVLATFYLRLRTSTGQENTCLSPVWLLMSVRGRGNRPRESTKINFRTETFANSYSCSGVGTTKTPSKVGKASKSNSHNCSGVGTAKTNVGKDSMSQNKGNNEEFGNYTNVQVTAPHYDVAENEQEEHVYEI